MPRGSLKRNVHIPWIMINIGGISLTWRGDRPDYFTSLSHVRKLDTANTMRINITYCPHVGEDPNRIEKAIYNGGGVCLVQYGDSASNCSRLFKAIIRQYNVSLDNGVLKYELDLISAAVCYNLSGFKHTYLDAENGDDLNTFVEVLNKAASMMSERYDFDAGPLPSSAKPFESKIIFGDEPVSPVKFIMKALQLIVPKKEGNFYTIDIDDAHQGKGKIKVVEVDPNEVHIAHEFTWGTRDGTVLSWNPKFDGGVKLAAYRGSLINDTITTSSMVNPDTGELATVTTDYKIKQDFTSAEDFLIVSDLIRDDEAFRKASEYAYKATLEVLGEGQTVYIGHTVISVTPIIMGQPHHSAGRYIVEGVTDNVSSSGFTTTYELLRYIEGDQQNLYSIDKLINSDMIWVNGTFVPYADYAPKYD